MVQDHSTPASRCQKCQELNLYIVDASQSRPFNHLDTFKQLETSAAKGCDLCQYLRKVLILCRSTYANPESSSSPIVVRKEAGAGRARYAWWYKVNCGFIDGDFPAPTNARITHYLRPKGPSTRHPRVSFEDDIEKTHLSQLVG